jgi:hypothetical protein
LIFRPALDQITGFGRVPEFGLQHPGGQTVNWTPEPESPNLPVPMVSVGKPGFF